MRHKQRKVKRLAVAGSQTQYTSGRVKCSTEHTHMSKKRSRQALSGTESTYNTTVVDVSSAGSVGCTAQIPSTVGPDIIA